MVANKTGPMLRDWLDRILGPNVPRRTRGVAHGGTSLTLRGVKETTKDVDFAFIDRADFDHVRRALEDAGYRVTARYEQFGELQLRLENPQEPIDIIDVRHPTWNHWAMKGLALRGCTRIRHGNFELLQPDVETALVFKTYPARASDIQDLKRLVEQTAPRWDRVRKIFEEQERLALDQETYAAALLITQVRGRALASLGTLAEAGVEGVQPLVGWIRERWNALGLPIRTAKEVLALVRNDENAWARFLTDHSEELARRSGIPP